MPLDTESERVATQIAFDELALAYAELAAALREAGLPTGVFNDIEQGVADRLTRFRRDSPVAAARPDLLAVAAQKIRGALRQAHGARDATGLPN